MFGLIARVSSRKGSNKNLEARLPGFLDSSAFDAVLQHEKMRADRSLVPFTMLLFDIRYSSKSGNNKDTRKADLRQLASIILSCSRGSDIKGWYRDGRQLRVALVLHNTKPENSERVKETVFNLFNDWTRSKYNGNGKIRQLVCDKSIYPKSLVKPDGPSRADRRSEDFEISPLNNRRSLIWRPLPIWKRIMDIVGSCIVLVLCSPVLLLTAIYIKIISPGPILFKQRRIGYLGKPFTMWKLRTMNANTDTSGHRQYLESLIKGEGDGSGGNADLPMVKQDSNNKQIIPLGMLIRKSSLDEIPQLINVLLGEMSMVGPRPPIPYEASEYLHWHKHRFETVPGMTGLWQVNGKNRTTFKEMVRLDIKYARNRTFWMDVVILIKTFNVVFSEVMSLLNAKLRSDEHEKQIA
jgi:lipopolysaccharide/colanic/teichoic acid biosynthesis glycosyltransferase